MNWILKLEELILFVAAVVETGASSTRAKARLRGDEAVSHPRPGSAKMETHSSNRCHGLKTAFTLKP